MHKLCENFELLKERERGKREKNHFLVGRQEIGKSLFLVNNNE